MNAELKYNGYTAQPSDYECQDGDLAAVLNLMPEKGALHPVTEPVTVNTFLENEKVIFIHETKQGDNYIIYNSSTQALSWLPVSSASTAAERTRLAYVYDLVQVTAVGNTLVVLDGIQMTYYLWKPGDYSGGTYKTLGNHIPDVEISFGLVGHPRLFSVSDDSHSTFSISFDSISEGSLRSDFSETNQNKITEQIMAKVNKFVAEQTVNKGRFCFPFFVRYALRLYDGTLTNHSAPILMLPSTKNGVLALWSRVTGRGSYTDANCDLFLMAASLDYGLVSGGGIGNWTDIVKSVDVFISKPIYTYDQNGKIKNLRDTDDMMSKFVGKLYNSGPVTWNSSLNRYVCASSVTEDALLGQFYPYTQGSTTINSDIPGVLALYSEWKFDQIYSMYFKEAANQVPAETFHMPEYGEDKIGESLRSCGTFYKLCSIDISELTSTYYRGTRKDIVVPDDYLQSLVTREAMTDDYLSHDKIRAERSFMYNNRLNLSGVYRTLFSGFSAASMFCYTSGNYNFTVGTSAVRSIWPAVFTYDYIDIYVAIKENGKTYWVNAYSGAQSLGRWHSDTDALGNPDKGAFLFYPNNNAYKMRIVSEILNKAYDVDLQQHEFLNGAFALLDFDTDRGNNSSGYIDQSYDNEVDVTNKLYTSEVNNPFFFPVTNINTIGTGKILGISTAAKALSQGQFGQFPLYAFTTDGVWALEVSAATGAFSARQPITRDVCINPDSITQIDSAVLFATDRGIMLIAGSQTQCITDTVDNNEEPFIFPNFPLADKVQQLLGTTGTQVFPERPFTAGFLSGCQMLYSYNRQQIIVFNPAYAYAYSYSLESKQWGMMQSNIVSRVISYPEALAMTDGYKLVDYSQEKNESGTYVVKSPQFLITRPIKLDPSLKDVHKTIDTIITRGHFTRGHVKTVLYGSRDLHSWFPIYTSVDHYLRHFRGTPYKYFRIALICSLTHDESIWGSSIQYTPKLTNQPR